MNEFKYFVIGFSLSLVGISLYTQIPDATQNQPKTPINNIKISLFKDGNANISSLKLAEIKKQTLLTQNTKETQVDNIKSLAYNANIADDIDNIDGIEDDEILNINTDDIIPIDFNSSSSIKNAKLNNNDNTIKVAHLPSNNLLDTEYSSSPWVVARGSKHIKNKILLENNQINDIELSANTTTDDNDDLSFDVAERIKQSIIFPIPEEILSDENLTPTFVKKTSPRKPEKQEPTLLKKKKTIEEDKSLSSSSILSNISSWLDKKQNTQVESKKIKPLAPIYSSQPATTNEPSISTISENIKQTKMKNIGDLYEAMQETDNRNKNNKITPTELKLSFNPGRAEISGQTLRWLKAFSEKAINENNIIQIRLDASASTDLQRKRLGLLYTIFTNNGVDVNTIDTAFSNIETDTFIIRTIKKATTNMEN